jgi:hypothetical protein
MIAVWSEVCWLCDGCCVYVCARGNAGLCVAVAVLGWCLCFGAGLAGRGCFWLRGALLPQVGTLDRDRSVPLRACFLACCRLEDAGRDQE